MQLFTLKEPLNVANTRPSPSKHIIQCKANNGKQTNGINNMLIGCYQPHGQNCLTVASKHHLTTQTNRKQLSLVTIDQSQTKFIWQEGGRSESGKLENNSLFNLLKKS